MSGFVVNMNRACKTMNLFESFDGSYLSAKKKIGLRFTWLVHIENKNDKGCNFVILDSYFVQLETTCSCRWQVGWYLTWSVIQMTGSLETRFICKALACHFRDLVGLLSIQK